MEDHGYYRSYVQCRDKLKKLKSDYKAIKDQNGRSGSNCKSWKWYDQMDTIYGHRPANNGRESGIDSAMDKRKRSLSQQEHSAQVTDCLRDMHADDIAQQDGTRAQRDNHLQLLLNDAREAREQEAALRREEAAQTAEFHRSFLGVFGQLVEAMRDRRV
ncbi:unnamed protein product [Arctogadus glacialis]